ncbi:MAG: DUF1508 domain-containing protein [Candidatus Eisenbacteria bacterium]|uniref:DUF1508 domain-containing protein n=1 Tax=Eiseniibacteriota bacterium TaxID=2212470 RepID=A0A849SPX5_UNCEI|nr:DUF1508 domain-containing protein [Candidatus Eisenbacteria bacterium]
MSFEIYVDRSNQWRWRMFANNNRIIGDSGEAYHNRTDCEAMVDWIKRNALTAQVRVKMTS